jgi:hypothetical protein
VDLVAQNLLQQKLWIGAMNAFITTNSTIGHIL